MSRRVNMPSADDLFRPTSDAHTDSEPGPESGPESGPDARASGSGPTAPTEQIAAGSSAEAEPHTRRRPSGRVRHDEKMTVYVTSDELLDLEHARLVMRRSQGLAVDRGRLVREAVAIALADFEARGAESEIVQRLRDA